MLPLSFLNTGEEGIVKAIKGKDETKRFLLNLGFLEGTKVKVINKSAGNIILNIKDTRVAIDKSVAKRIFV